MKLIKSVILFERFNFVAQPEIATEYLQPNLWNLKLNSDRKVKKIIFERRKRFENQVQWSKTIQRYREIVSVLLNLIIQSCSPSHLYK